MTDAKEARREGNDRFDIRFIQMTVEVKVSDNLDISDVDLDDPEHYFARKSIAAFRPSHKHDFDVCRAIVKWAMACNGKLQSVQIWHDKKKPYGPDNLYLRFDFDNSGMSEEFRRDLHKNVEGAIQHWVITWSKLKIRMRKRPESHSGLFCYDWDAIKL